MWGTASLSNRATVRGVGEQKADPTRDDREVARRCPLTRALSLFAGSALLYGRGAGGSSYIGGVTNGSTVPGVRLGEGLVTISW
jgi:hypothetical protein